MNHKVWKLQRVPATGPVDGQIASAGGKFGGILDRQTADRWFKIQLQAGKIHLRGNIQRLT